MTPKPWLFFIIIGMVWNAQIWSYVPLLMWLCYLIAFVALISYYSLIWKEMENEKVS